MKIEIQSPHFKASKSLTDLVKKEIKRLSVPSRNIVSADVTLTFDHFGKNMQQCCHIRLSVGGKDIFVKARADSFEKAISGCVDTIKQKLNKNKKRSPGSKTKTKINSS
jgi:ribosomal subunit interface protein